MTVLVCTRRDDNFCIPQVLETIRASGTRAFRFDTDAYPTEAALSLELGPTGERRVLRTAEGELDLDEVSAVWHRRLPIGARIPREMEPALHQASVDESREALLGLLAALPAFQLDPWWVLRRAGHKQLQLSLARDLGFEVPRTLVSNDPHAVRAFAASCGGDIIAKPVRGFVIREEGQEEGEAVFTSRVRPEDLEDLESLRYCPMIFQERLPKALELRVTLIGDRVYVASVDSQSLEHARDDWRRGAYEFMDIWQPYELPPEVRGRLLTLMDRLGLNYGAVDIIVTPDGRYVFLEINPSGEFAWLTLQPGFPLSQALADLLVGRIPRRVPPSQLWS